VDIAKAILSCWGRTRHLPDPRPDLDEYQEQMLAIHAFLSNPEAIRKLEAKRTTHQDSQPASLLKLRLDELPLEFTNGHVQLEWDHGRWMVRDWKTTATPPLGKAWIQPEENLLSALIRGPSRPEGVAPPYLGQAKLAMGIERTQREPLHNTHIQLQARERQEWPHENTEIMVGYLHKMRWRTPFLRRLRSLSKQWQMAIYSLPCAVLDFSTCCLSNVQPRNSFRLGLVRDDRIICHNRKAYERLQWDDNPRPRDRTPD